MKNIDKKITSPIKDWKNIVIVNKSLEPIAVIDSDQVILKDGYDFKINVGVQDLT
ncbi:MULTISPECIES: hypothetical protein [Companilactobacillus]|uniref:hypothetical protein n=1 Tax=Companilactobacillus TaxID=2767879 RepID=UPI000A5426E5|nr:hypothetical protein [Companilactobacillus nantensis]GEO64443.1 hypothetical protein LNA01_16260 [Companilactobacillus nantensis]